MPTPTNLPEDNSPTKMSATLPEEMRERVPDCVFCKKIKEGSVIKVSDHVVRFEPLNPVVRGHMLFVPIEHAYDAAHRPTITARTVKAAAKYMGVLEESSNLIINNGTDASQTIFHLHVHVVPRTKDDGLLLPWSNIDALLEEATHQTAKAYGGCKNCYGKGYATVNDQWIANDTDEDIGSPGGYVRGSSSNAMKFCACDRGQQLKVRFEEATHKAQGEAEIALARKVLAVSGGHNKIKGFTQAKRLKLLTNKMNEIIPDVFGIVEETTIETSPSKESKDNG